jgi:2'-5' RNA ligase
MRLFIAIELPESVRVHLAGMQELLGPLAWVRWMRPDQLHLTLRFLGETSDQQLAELTRALEDCPISLPIRLHAAAAVCFPDRGPIRIIAAELADADGRCAKSQAQIESACRRFGFAPERRPWRPHVTLARLKGHWDASLRQKVQPAVAAMLPGPEFEPAEFAVIESRQLPQGREYVTAARVPLDR